MRIKFYRHSIPQKWKVDQIGNRLKLNYGKSQADVRAIDGDIPVYGTGGLIEFGNQFLSPGDSVLIGRKGTLDNPLYIDHPFWPVDTTYYTSDFDGSTKWLYYLVQTLDLAALNEATGVPSLSRDTFYSLEVPFPPKPEQVKIAQVLSTIDHAIEQTEALITKYRRIKTGLMQDLLTRGIDANGILRNPFACPEQFKDSQVGRMPEEWEVVRFEELADVIDPQPDHRAPPAVRDGEPYVGVGDFHTDGSINFESCRKVSLEAVLKQEKRFRIERGDILFGKIGTVGVPRLLPYGMRYALNANTVLIKPQGNAPFVFWLLQSSFVEEQIKMQTHLTSQPAFGIQKIRAMLAPKPSDDEQARIAAIFDAQDAHIRNEENHHTKLQRLKTGLMQDLLTGKVSVAPLLAANKEGEAV
jgi:type I restriction enzyme S subunit